MDLLVGVGDDVNSWESVECYVQVHYFCSVDGLVVVSCDDDDLGGVAVFVCLCEVSHIFFDNAKVPVWYVRFVGQVPGVDDEGVVTGLDLCDRGAEAFGDVQSSCVESFGGGLVVCFEPEVAV